MDKLINDYELRLVEPECAPGAGRWGALVMLPGDISAVFPYLNAVIIGAWYDHENRVLIWRQPEQAFAFRPREIRLARVEDTEDARRIAGEVIERVNETWQKRDGITPRYVTREMPSVMDILKLLPLSNCRACGYPTCMAFAADVRAGKVMPESCPPLCAPDYAAKKDRLTSLIAAE